MKILIISGFLGAGKTTFIKAMAKATGREFVIVENEFASENIDGQILEQDEAIAQMEIVELSEGCICCSLDLDFSFSVMTIANTLNPDYLVVEPSGVAQPTNIIESLQKIQYEKIQLLAPITMIDAEHYAYQNRDFKNYFQDQLIAAGTLVLSKSEGLDPDSFSAIAEELEVPSDVDFPLEHYSNWPKEKWLDLLQKEFTGEDIKRVGERFTQRQIKREADQDLTNMTLKDIKFMNPDQVYAFMEEILNGDFGYIIRAKGFIRAKDEIIHVELVQNRVEITGLVEEDVQAIEEDNAIAKENDKEPEYELNKFIVIGKDLKKQKLKARVNPSKRVFKLKK